MALHVYGIKNCDTMKKALAWLESHKVAHVFHDYKKEGADAEVIARAIQLHGWENVLNRKGTTWRALSDAEKQSMNDARALKAALANPSLVRRPLAVQGKNIFLGFDPDVYKAFK